MGDQSCQMRENEEISCELCKKLYMFWRHTIEVWYHVKIASLPSYQIIMFIYIYDVIKSFFVRILFCHIVGSPKKKKKKNAGRFHWATESWLCWALLESRWCPFFFFFFSSHLRGTRLSIACHSQPVPRFFLLGCYLYTTDLDAQNPTSCVPC